MISDRCGGAGSTRIPGFSDRRSPSTASPTPSSASRRARSPSSPRATCGALTIDPPKEMRLNHVIFVAGRLKPGISPRAAQVEMDAIAARMAQQYPEMRDWA
jgi:hypothetical protein